jgi:hypothetical protein
VFLLSTPAMVYLGNYEDRLPHPLRFAAAIAIATIGLSVYDVMGRTAYAAFMSMSLVTLCFFVVVAALWSLRARAAA